MAIFWGVIPTEPIIVQTWSDTHFFVIKFARKAIFLFFFFDCFKGFRWKKFVWKIIPTIPIITDLIRSLFLSLMNSLETQFFIYFSSTSLRRFIWRNFFQNHKYRTRHSSEARFVRWRIHYRRNFITMFFELLKGFHWKDCFCQIPTTRREFYSTIT